MVLIGVTPCRDAESGRLYLNRDYLDALQCLNAVPVILPMETRPEALAKLLQTVDGLLLSGGEDVSPSRYQEERLPCCGRNDAERDETETAACRMALQMDMPVLAICRGIQVLNVTLGGTLYQDVELQYGNTLKHPVYDRPRDQVHGVSVIPGTRLHQIVGLESIRVNSRHHQAVKEPGKGLIITARATDGLIEGVEMPEKRFVVGVQWHPESLRSYVPEAHALFAAFVQAGREYAAGKRA